jgi:hypothetical protein
MIRRIERPELLSHSAFWAVHMWNVTRGPIATADSDLADAAFNLPTDTIEEFYTRELSDENQWPHFLVRLPRGFSIEVEYANAPEDNEVIYRISHGEWVSGIRVGKGGGHWMLPAFRWTELLQIARSIDETQAAGPAASQALLLLFPAAWLTGDDDLEEVRQHLHDAWIRLGLVPGVDTGLLVDQLIAASGSDVQWRRREGLGWVNDGENSYRNPDARAHLDDREFRDVLRFMEMIAEFRGGGTCLIDTQ